MVLAHLGETYLSLGDQRGAREAWDESLLILRTLHIPRPARSGRSSPACRAVRLDDGFPGQKRRRMLARPESLTFCSSTYFLSAVRRPQAVCR